MYFNINIQCLNPIDIFIMKAMVKSDGTRMAQCNYRKISFKMSSVCSLYMYKPMTIIK